MTSHATTFFTPRVTSRHLLARGPDRWAVLPARNRARPGAADCFVPWVTQAPRLPLHDAPTGERPDRFRVSSPAGGARRAARGAGRGTRGRAGRAGPAA